MLESITAVRFGACRGAARWWLVVLIVGRGCLLAHAEDGHQAITPAVREVVKRYCLNCHTGDAAAGKLDLQAALDGKLAQHTIVWERAVRKLASGQMPPAGEPRPDEQVLDATIEHLVRALDERAGEHPRPGRTDTFRRLNRFEYQNAIRDLLALEIDASQLLPADESSHGFDNVTVTDLPPALLAKYISAARKISRLTVGSPVSSPAGQTWRIKPDVTQDQHVPGLPLGTRGGVLLRHTFQAAGEYELQVRLARDRDEHVEGLDREHQLEILIDRRHVSSIKIVPPRNRENYFFDDDQLKTRIQVSAGPHDLGVTFVKQGSSLLETKRQPLNVHFNAHRHPRLGPAVYQVSLIGPFDPDGQQPARTETYSRDTPSRERVFCCYPTKPEEEETCARQIIARLMRRAYRRPVSEDELAQPLAFYREARAEAGFEAGIEMALSAILVSPRFLIRMERDPDGIVSGSVYQISDQELATRLSFFLWSSIPDDELLDVVEKNQLRDPDVLRRQLKRMLADPRSEALATSFASQWLYLRNLDSKTPDPRLYPDFDDNLRQAFRRETELCFQEMVREDRSLLDLLKSDSTWLNERLARHYGIPHVVGSHFRRVELEPDSQRGGLLRHGSILTVTSYATRTSPVVRGHWILENILGTPTPPPPPDVPALDQSVINANLPIRERLAQHRENASCASCHNVIDPVGFTLENFDAVGRWRVQEAGRLVDARGGLPGGKPVDGVSGLEDGILKHPEMFVSTASEKLMTYALGRGILEDDGPAIRAVVRNAARNDYRFSAIVWEIVNSPAFQMRTAE